MENEEIKKELLHRFELIIDTYLKVTDEDVKEICDRGILSKDAIYHKLFHTLCRHITDYENDEIKEIL